MENEKKKNRRLERFKNIMTGREVLEQKTKLKSLVLALILVHMILMFYFVGVTIWPLVAYHLMVVMYYTHVHSQVLLEKYLRAYVMSFIELYMCTILSVILIGWGAGFYFYIIALVPAAYYMLLSVSKIRNRVLIPFYMTLTSMLVEVVLFLWTRNHEPIFSMEYKDMQIMYGFNLVIVIAFIGALSFTFIVEALDAQSHLLRQNQNLDHVASVDPLTGLRNRRSMEKILDEAMEQAKQKGELFSVILGDIDDFKKVNDTYGHDCGDLALVHVADIMKRHVRECDAVCRWGGEEFLVFLSGNLESACSIAERIRYAVEHEVIEYKGIDIPFTMTFGVAMYEPGFRKEVFIKRADDNLYEGKKAGKNRIIS